MSIIKTIKFDLPIDGVKVKSIEELREHFTAEILDLYYSGLLIRWLQSRRLGKELGAVQAIRDNSEQFLLMKRLCEIFKVEADDLLISLAVGEPGEKVEKTFPEIAAQYRAVIYEEIMSKVESDDDDGYTVSGQYLIYEDGTVVDTKTNLMWKRQSEYGTYVWGDAIRMFGQHIIHFAGYNDWRMPTREELKTLVDRKYCPTIDPIAFPNTSRDRYWSSTADGTDVAWYVNFYNGYDYWDDRDVDYHVRLVRSGQ